MFVQLIKLLFFFIFFRYRMNLTQFGHYVIITLMYFWFHFRSYHHVHFVIFVRNGYPKFVVLLWVIILNPIKCNNNVLCHHSYWLARNAIFDMMSKYWLNWMLMVRNRSRRIMPEVWRKNWEPSVILNVRHWRRKI